MWVWLCVRVYECVGVWVSCYGCVSVCIVLMCWMCGCRCVGHAWVCVGVYVDVCGCVLMGWCVSMRVSV